MYYKKNNLFVLSYGISATNEPSTSWDFERIGITKPNTIGEYLNGIDHDSTYDSSYLFKAYPLDRLIEDLKDVDTSDDVSYKEIKFMGKAIEEFFTFDHDINEIATHYTKQMNDCAPSNRNVTISDTTMDISSIIDIISQTGLLYSPVLVKRFAYSLMWKI